MKTLKYLALAVLTISFTACSQEDDFVPQGGNEQEIRVAFTTDAI